MKVYSIITDVIEQQIDAEKMDDDVCKRLDEQLDKMLRNPKNTFGKRHYATPNSAIAAVGGLEYDGKMNKIFYDCPKAVDTETMDKFLDDYWYSILIENYTLENLMEILPEDIQQNIGQWFQEYLWHVAQHEGIELYDEEE